jgi:S-DNA-T family DNA segregation ATPase FtsK/SpoIIIE
MPVFVPRGRVVLRGDGVVADALERRLVAEPEVQVVRASIAENPAADEVTLRVVTPTCIEVTVPGRPRIEARPEFVSRVALDAARRAHPASAQPTPPDRVPWSAVSAITRRDRPDDGDSLAQTRGIPFGHNGRDVIVLDLERDGPHALIGGTTGSGKSEFLRTLALGWAARRSPAELQLLFIDFKGGATFAGLTDLPHAVGLVTDLDPLVAERAVRSLRAELRRRERVLVEAGVRDLSHRPELFARLVVLVDEFAALIETFPDVQAVFADISARGRSLGVHLVLCTQHPAAVVRDAVAANCAVRIAFRMSDTAGAAFIGAAGRDLSSALPGRAVVVTGEGTSTAQVATIDDTDISAVCAHWSGVQAAHSPWLPPLPAVLEQAALDTIIGAAASFTDPQGADLATRPGGVAPLAFGVLDDPAEQRQLPATWSPHRDGALAVIGAPRSGRSTALAALASAARRRGAPVLVLPTTVVEAWALLEQVVEHPLDGALLLADDLDHLLAATDDLGNEFLLRWDAAAREIRRAGGGVAASIGPVSTSRSVLSGRFESRLLLRCLDADDHHLAGAPRGLFDRGAPPGRGWWADRHVHVVTVPAETLEPTRVPAPVWTIPSDVDTIIIARHVGSVALPIRETYPHHHVVTDPAADQSMLPALSTTVSVTPRIYIADPDGWQATWPLFSSLRRTSPIVVTGAEAADVRSLLGLRATPPPIDGRAGEVWVIEPGGPMRRRSSITLTAG